MLLAAPSTSSPRDSQLRRAGEGPADRVLLFGNGVLHGWGVSLRGMAVPGHLAQLLQERTGRAAIVDFVGEERMNAASAQQWLGDAAGRGHDVAVVAVGLNDALRLTALPSWRTQMSGLVDRIRADQDPRARVLLVGLPHVRAFAMADSAMGTVAQRHAAEMDMVLQEIAAEREDVTFVTAPQERFEPGLPLGSAGMYRSWAEQLLPAVLPVLEVVRSVKPVAGERRASWSWSGTAAALGADGTDAQAQLDALTEMIRERYGVAMAGVHVLDGDQVYSIAGRSGGPRQMPRSLAYCDRTVRADAPTVIVDADADPEFRGNPFLDVVGLPFYAGVPLHGSDGLPVGTLCILDDVARPDFDPNDLRQFVVVAESALRSFEPGTPMSQRLPGPAITTAQHGSVIAQEQAPTGLRVLAMLLRPLLHVVFRRFLRRQARPHWDNRAVALGSGRRPLRVLVFGAGFAVGYGSDGGDDPLPAQLSSALAAATGRGVIVETRARPSVALEQCLELRGSTGAAGFDHVVWAPTLEEATRRSSRGWTRQLQHIVAAVQLSAPPHMRLTLLGLPLVDGDHILHRVGRVLGRQVNRQLELAARANVRTGYLPLPHRVLPAYDTPMFDAAYRTEVTALITEHLLDQQQAASSRSEQNIRVPAQR